MADDIKRRAAKYELEIKFPKLDPTTAQKELIANQIGCHLNTVKNALRDLRNGRLDKLEKEKRLKKDEERQLDKRARSIKMASYGSLVSCPHCPGAYANELRKFVGFRGSLKEIKDHRDRVVKYASLDITGGEHRGEARPEPIVPISKKRNLPNLMRLTGKSEQELRKKQKTKYFVGILGFEVEVMTLMFTLRGMGYEDIMVLMSRGHGKTYMNGWGCQMDLKWFQQNIMMLSETSARLKVGNWIYLWALHHNFLRNPKKFARKSTYQHFELVNDTRMDIYKYSEENLVGEHDYKLKLDDTVKKKWGRRPTENEKMNEHWDSNINYIIRTGLEDFGTRKYEGDPLQHRMDTIDDIVIIKMSPFIRCQCEESNINPQGTYDPCPICRDLCLVAPEIHSYAELMNKMEANYDSWYSEMMQDPHPRKGGMVEEDDIVYVDMPLQAEIKMFCISVDVAEVWEEDDLLADMSAVISCVMSGERDSINRREWHRKFTFFNSIVKRMPFRDTKRRNGKLQRGIIETIDSQVRFIKTHYLKKTDSNASLIIAIERNGPGIILIDQILREKWPWMKMIIADKGKAVKWTKDSKANVKLGINHRENKVARVSSELKHSIKNSQTRFTQNIEYSTFMSQLLSFPKGKHDDGPDAGGMGKDELNRRWSVKKLQGSRKAKQIERKLAKQALKFEETMAKPWIAENKMRDRVRGRQKRIRL